MYVPERSHFSPLLIVIAFYALFLWYELCCILSVIYDNFFNHAVVLKYQK